jgi:predicted transcriptional regulator
VRNEGSNEREVRLKSQRRNGFDITRDILQVCAHGANKTHIVYAANLNSKRISKYLEFCAKMKFLNKQRSGGSFIYQTTSEGLYFLRNYFEVPQEENGGIN